MRFVSSYDPEGLKVGGPKYEIIQRVRELRLVSATADSGLLEVLEKKGLTLSQVSAIPTLGPRFFSLANTCRKFHSILSTTPAPPG